jgi:UDP-N-acetylglucosamine 4-epimerase
MKILITGGAGFIGSNLCEALLEKNNEVLCLDNFSTGHRHNLDKISLNPAFTLITGDIRNQDDCINAVKGVDYVLHHAALGSVPRSIEDPVTTTDVNIGGFVKMLDASRRAGVKRFIYAASSSTYGDHPGLPKQEHVIGNPLSPYAITKYANEIFAKNFSKIYGIETVGLRYFNVFGRQQDPGGAYAAVIPRFVKLLMKHQSPVINGDGSFSRDFTYIDNVIRANEVAMAAATAGVKQNACKYYAELGLDYDPAATLAEVFNVACGDQTSLTELIQFLKDNLAGTDPSIALVDAINGPERAGDVPHSMASIEKGKALFGYHPEISVREGLKKATEWYWKNYLD